MTLPLRLLLFYVNTFKPEVDTDRLSPEAMRNANRKELKKIWNLIDTAPCVMESVADGVFQARDGAKIPFRYYRPPGVTGTKSILFFHGGGFVTRDLESHDRACRRIARENRMPVFSIAYRLAPEHKFPVPVEDCEDAFKWLVNNANEYEINPAKITVMGDSAGANLATAVCLLCKQKSTLTPWRQVLIYPTVDARLCHPSIDRLGKNYFLTKELMQWFVNQYQQTEEDILNPLMSPLLAEDVSGLPPAYVCTAEFDPLLDEGYAYAQKLEEAGVEVKYRKFEGVIHGFLNLRRLCVTQNQRLHEEIAGFLK
jgi:acetyl esterase